MTTFSATTLRSFIRSSAGKLRAVLCFVFGAALLAGLALGLVGCTSNSPGAATGTMVNADTMALNSPTITVTAKSEVKAVPDRAKIGVAVTTQAATAEETQEQNATGTNAVIEALRELGIDEKSIQTTDTWLNPRYDYNNYEIAYLDDESEESTNIVGYEMTTRLSVADLEIEQVGEVLQACVAAGATNSDGIQYYSSEYDAKYAEALAAAVEAARAKAEVLAQASGVNLGGVFSVTEGYQNTAYSYNDGLAFEAAEDTSASMKVMPGEVNIEANVTVAYEIN